MDQQLILFSAFSGIIMATHMIPQLLKFTEYVSIVMLLLFVGIQTVMTKMFTDLLEAYPSIPKMNEYSIVTDYYITESETAMVLISGGVAAVCILHMCCTAPSGGGLTVATVVVFVILCGMHIDKVSEIVKLVITN